MPKKYINIVFHYHCKSKATEAGQLSKNKKKKGENIRIPKAVQATPVFQTHLCRSAADSRCWTLMKNTKKRPQKSRLVLAR